MKKFFRFTSYIFVFLLVFIILLVAVAKLSEKHITDIALKKVSEEIEAPVAIQDVSFNLVRQFPRATIELEGVSFCGKMNPNLAAKPDTLLQLEKIFVAVKSKPLMRGIIKVIKVDMREGHVNYQVDSNGVSSIDFLMNAQKSAENDTTPGKPLYVTLEEFTAENLVCYYRDSLHKLAGTIAIPKLEINGKLAGKTMEGAAKGQLQLSRFTMAKTPLHLMNQAELNFDASYQDDSLSLKKMNLNTDGTELSLLGGIKLGEVIKTDLTIKEGKLTIQELMKYMPSKIIRDLELKDFSGEMKINGTIQGNYSQTEIPRVNMHVSYQDGKVHIGDYPEIQNLRFRSKLTNGFLQNNRSTQVEFSNLAFETEKSRFDISFSMQDIDKPQYSILTNMLVDLEEWKRYVPHSLLQDMKGQLGLKLKTKGVLPDTIDKNFADFLLANTQAEITMKDIFLSPDSVSSINNLSGSIHYKPHELQLENLTCAIPSYNLLLDSSSVRGNFKGSITNLSEMEIFLENYHLRTPRSSLKGRLQLRNLENPDYRTESQLRMNLAEIKGMLPDSVIRALDGEIHARIRSAATINLDSLSNTLPGILFNNGSYDLHFSNVHAEMTDYPDYVIQDLNGNITLDRSVVQMKRLSGKAAGISFGIDSTIIRNAWETVVLNQPEKLKVQTRMDFGHLDHKHIMALIPASETDPAKPETDETEPMNYSISMKGVARVKSFQYDSVYLENFSTLFNIQDSIYTVDQLKFDAFGGHINTSMNYVLKPGNRAVIQMRNSITQMDIRKLLKDFHDFEAFYEPAIRNENLSGLLTCDFYTKADIVNDSLIQEKLRIRGDFTLEDGGVYDFEPATELSKKTSINELDNIQFKTLNSQVFILDGAIYVPKTYISSTALDITAYGMQEFGTDYEYHLKLHLSDILLGKSEKLLKEQDKMGDIADKDERKNAVYMVSYSENGKAKTKFDKKKLQSAMKTKIRLQERLLKLRFHPEMFKFETGVYPND